MEAHSVAKAPERVVTERLVLRRPTAGDAPNVYAYARDPEVTRLLAFPTHRSVADTERFLADCPIRWEKGEEFCWIITLKDADDCIGAIGCRMGTHGPDIGYVLARPYWGRGYMSEAVRAVVEWASALPDVHRVWAYCDVDNAASARVLEKVGMSREGVLRKWSVSPNVSPTPRDCYVYALVRRD